MNQVRVGISVLSHANQNIWENGIGQNVVFLAECLRGSEWVSSVILIDVGDQGKMAPQVDLASIQLRMVSQHEASDEVDLIIEMSGALNSEWLSLMRARGKKVVFHCCGQPYVALAEPTVFRKQAVALPAQRCDEVWLLHKDAELAPMMRTLHRCPVVEVPYLWSDQFIRQRVKDVATHGLRFGFDADSAASQGLRTAIFEPNISVVKTSSIPMLVCDEAYRADRNAVSAMHVLNTLHMRDHPTLLHLANSLDLVRQHKATFHGRHDVAGFMSQHANAVVSHQWMNHQNYNYFDVLFGDYPLIHNSPWLSEFGAGYYYPGFDAVAGARQLLRAARAHADNLEGYRQRSKLVFDAVDPANPANLAAYEHRIRALMQI